ncbi:MAG: putative baseplate assembly protein [Pyrinomonadaceae bacterium]
MNSSEICKDTNDRRRRIRERASESGENEPNGIDYVEIEVNEEQKTIKIVVYFLNKAPGNIEGPQNVLITGGVRIRDIKATAIRLCIDDDPEEDDCLRVTLNKAGDFSTYTLRLVNARDGRPTDTPLDGLDPRYAQIDFSFKASCPSDLDCVPQETCYEEAPTDPDINYLAKDYSSFRQLILDRLSLIMPDWKERHVPDTGIALVELLAYVGDYLSYYQDAVATEAYLDTARLRISVRRHARLIDYRAHEGCNARAWVLIRTSADVTLDNPKDVYFITGHSAAFDGRGDLLTSYDLRNVPRADYEVFEPLLAEPRPLPIELYEGHNRISFYTWGDRSCCLPRGATSATLKDRWVEKQTAEEEAVSTTGGENAPDETEGRGGEDDAQEEYREQPGYNVKQAQEQPKESALYKPPPRRERLLKLKVGDVLIFEEALGPRTGVRADADTSHRHAVRLTKVEPYVDRLYDRPVVLIEWEREDALPFTLCISTIGEAPGCRYLEDVSVARGNVLLVDHGRTVTPEVWEVPAATEENAGCLGPFEPRETILRSGRFRPRLKFRPLTYQTPFPEPAAVARVQAQFLGQLIGEVRLRVEQRLEQTRRGQRLSEEQLAELTTIFGSKTLTEVGLRRRGTKDKSPQGSEEQAAALERLLAGFERFLARKTQWVKVLRERVMNAYLMSDAQRREIAEMFGEGLAAGLRDAEGKLPVPASLALRQQPRDALPHIMVRTERTRQRPEERRRVAPPSYYPRWFPQLDLLGSSDQQRHFVAEVDNEGYAHLRFGDGELGRALDPHTTLKATYRTGNGTAGNVGAEAISRIVFRQTKLSGVTLSVRNPLPAQGGIDPETIADVKMLAPGAFRKDLQRAVIAEDYSRLAERSQPDKVQRAASNLRWAGSWYEMQTAIDPRGNEEAGEPLLASIEGSLYPYRRIGHDFDARQARYIPLAIALEVCVLPHYLRGHVKAALTEVFSNRVLPNGQRGLFHPDNLTFGESIYMSKLTAAAQGVDGVESARVTLFQRQFESANGELEAGVLPVGPMEVARLDNDPNFPEHGILQLDVRGGR